jgi:hypothetical protein
LEQAQRVGEDVLSAVIGSSVSGVWNKRKEWARTSSRQWSTRKRTQTPRVMNQPRAMITFFLGYKRRAPFLRLKQTQSSSKGVLSAISQEKQTPRKKNTAFRTIRTTSSRKISLSSNSPTTD